MKITYQAYEQSFFSDLDICGKRIRKKWGYYIYSNSGISELSFLPFLHRDTLRDHLERLTSFFTKNSLDGLKLNHLDLTQKGFGLFSEKDLCSLTGPSLFALETFLLSQFNLSLPKENAKNPVSNELIFDLKHLPPLENKTYKIKIGRSNKKDEIKLLQQWAMSAHQSSFFRWRLDGNRLLGPNDLNDYWKNLPQKHIEYFEEPLAHFKQHEKIAASIPLALDESAEDYIQRQYPFPIVAMVIKPTALSGGFSQCFKLLQASPPWDIVISSTFENNIGHAFLESLSRLSDRDAGLNRPAFSSLYYPIT